jgi:membrane protein
MDDRYIKKTYLKKYYHIVQNKFSNLPVIKQILDWSKWYAPPGFSGVPLYYVISFIIEEAKKDNLTMRSNSIAFSLFIAIFPGIIFLFTLLPHIPIIQDYVVIIDRNLNNMLPRSAYEYLSQILIDITSIKRSGLLSLGFFLSLFFASNGMITLMSGFDKSYNDVFARRSFIRKRFIALSLTVVLSGLFIVVIAMVVLSRSFIDWLSTHYVINDWLLLFFSNTSRFVLGISLIYTGISFIYQYGPSLYRKSPFLNVGAMTSTLLFIGGTYLFSFFINNFGRYNEIYGSIGALIVVMIWFQVTSFILLVGFELNASIAVVKSNMLIEQNKKKL